jgi:hypothetical protein
MKTTPIYEQWVRVSDSEGNSHRCRRIRIVLKKATRDGDKVLVLLTNLSKSAAHAKQVAQMYRKRWTIGVSGEGHITQSVKVRPRPRDSGLVAREAPWRESKTVKPSDHVLIWSTATH